MCPHVYLHFWNPPTYGNYMVRLGLKLKSPQPLPRPPGFNAKGDQQFLRPLLQFFDPYPHFTTGTCSKKHGFEWKVLNTFWAKLWLPDCHLRVPRPRGNPSQMWRSSRRTPRSKVLTRTRLRTWTCHVSEMSLSGRGVWMGVG